MSSGIENSLNLRSLSDIINDDDGDTASSISELEDQLVDDDESTEQDIDVLGGLSEQSNLELFSNLTDQRLENEFREIREKALEAFEDIKTAAMGVNPERSARLFEVSGQFLKAALDSTTSRSNRQLHLTKLKMQAKRLSTDGDLNGVLTDGKHAMLDRNQILKALIDESASNIIDIDADEVKNK